MRSLKPMFDTPVQARNLSDPGGDPRERFATAAARPAAPQPRSERLAGPFRVKASYLERRAWPFNG